MWLTLRYTGPIGDSDKDIRKIWIRGSAIDLLYRSHRFVEPDLAYTIVGLQGLPSEDVRETPEEILEMMKSDV